MRFTTLPEYAFGFATVRVCATALHLHGCRAAETQATE